MRIFKQFIFLTICLLIVVSQTNSVYSQCATFGDVNSGFSLDSIVNCNTTYLSLDTTAFSYTGPLTYIWKWDDGTSYDTTSMNSMNHVFNNPSYKYCMSVTVIDSCGNDTTSKCRKQLDAPYISAVPSFTYDACDNVFNSGFGGMVVGLTTLISMDWGDGTIDTFTNTGAPFYFRLITLAHTYSASGPYAAILKTEGPCGKDSVIYNLPVSFPNPVANFSFSPDTAKCPGDLVSFTDLSTPGSQPIEWNWSFGDLGGDTVKNPTYIYSKGGLFTIELEVTDLLGCSNSFSDTIIVIDTLTKPDFTVIANCPCNDITLSTSSSATSLYWDLGDGNFANGTLVNHTYNSPDNQFVSLTKIDVLGCISTKTISIDICSGEYLNNSMSNNRWFFQGKGGVQFSSGIPVFDTLGKMGSSNIEGAATISDPITGNLLFYTNGVSVWDSTHTIMPNGTGLLSGGSTTQGVLIVPFPGDKTKYYVFTNNGVSSGGPYAIRYSVVDMTLNAGKGDIVASSKSTLLQVHDGREAMTGTVRIEEACNSPAQYWVAVPSNTNIYLYLVDSSGVSLYATYMDNAFAYSGLPSSGASSFSPDGSKYALVQRSTNIDSNKIFLLDFNSNIGIFSNLRTIHTTYKSYGLAFSPNGNILYASTQRNNATENFNIAKYDLSSTDISSSEGLGPINVRGAYSMYLGDDDKIYFRNYGPIIDYPYLGIINNPNNFNNPGMIRDGVFLGKPAQAHGLQNIVRYVPAMKDTAIALYTFTSQNCGDVDFQNISIVPLKSTCDYFYDTVSYLWDFGDGVTSALANPFHQYLVSDTYNVSLIVNASYLCTPDTMVQTVIIDDVVQIDLGADVDTCFLDSIEIVSNSIGVGISFLWSTGANTQSIKVVESDEYWLQASKGLCVQTDSVQYTLEPCDTPNLFIPNAFSPNGDGENDHFIIRAEGIEEIMLKIYDRWGNLVFQSNDISIGWNGYYKKGNPQLDGVYVYRLIGKFIDDTSIDTKGNLTLVR